MRERSDLVAAVRSSDRATLESVVRECLPALMRTAVAAGLPLDRAEDAVQSALVVFLQRAGDFDGRARVSTWIQGILMRKIWEERRGIRRDAEHDEIDDVVERRFDADGRWVHPPEGPLEALSRGLLHRELSVCLEALPDRQRVAFALREVEGFDTEEVCNILEVTANNLGVLLFRARNRMRECLESKGIERSSDASL
jgi:RNA polymerase sigma-70 factor, ECF subfamily